MVKQFKFIKTATAGNRTGFFLDERALLNRDTIMNNVLRKVNLEAEQYGFLSRKDEDCIMTTAGDELCGGAILASPSVLGKFSGKTNVITLGKKLESVVTNKDKNKIYVESKIPIKEIYLSLERVKINCLGGIEGFKVLLNGIAYFVTKEKINIPLNTKIFTLLDMELNTQNITCLGVIQVLNDYEICPVVWVKKLGTITYEKGCTTGTIATQMSFARKDNTWYQPSGEFIKAEINDNITIEAGVEILSEGQIYIDT